MQNLLNGNLNSLVQLGMPPAKMPTSLIVIVGNKKMADVTSLMSGGAEIKVNVSGCLAVCLKTRLAWPT